MSQTLKPFNSLKSAKVIVRHKEFGDFAALFRKPRILTCYIQCMYPLETEWYLILANESLLFCISTSTSWSSSRQLSYGITEL